MNRLIMNFEAVFSKHSKSKVSLIEVDCRLYIHGRFFTCLRMKAFGGPVGNYVQPRAFNCFSPKSLFYSPTIGYKDISSLAQSLCSDVILIPYHLNYCIDSYHFHNFYCKEIDKRIDKIESYRRKETSE